VPKEKDIKVEWYFKPITVYIVISLVGPLALPLLWKSPAFSKKLKVIITVLVIVLTIIMIKVSMDLYHLLLDEISELAKMLNIID